MFEIQTLLQITDNVSDRSNYELLRICYFNSLSKYFRKICDYKNTFKRINDIFKEIKM